MILLYVIFLELMVTIVMLCIDLTIIYSSWLLLLLLCTLSGCTWYIEIQILTSFAADMLIYYVQWPQNKIMENMFGSGSP